MADYFTQFSENITELTPDERDWIRHRLSPEDTGDSVWPDFGWAFVNADETLWIHSDESGSVDNVAAFVQEFLRKFRPTSFWKLTWASTCSRLRVGELGGGALFVTARRVKFMNTFDWVSYEEQKFKNASKVRKKVAANKKRKKS